MDGKKLEHCIQLIRRLPPGKIDQNINAISNLIYEEDELLNAFLQKVDTPSSINTDQSFLMCEYNRDGDSYRSPHNNKYYPPIEDGKYPSKQLRDLEIKMNKIFYIYATQYYSNSAISSVYLYELCNRIQEGFIVAILIKSTIESEKELNSGTWDSVNFIYVTFNQAESLTVTYKITTTIILKMKLYHKHFSDLSLSGTLTRQVIEH
jgi:capping protein beta